MSSRRERRIGTKREFGTKMWHYVATEESMLKEKGITKDDVAEGIQHFKAIT